MNSSEEKRAIMVVRDKAGKWRLPSHWGLASVGGISRTKLRHSQLLSTSKHAHHVPPHAQALFFPGNYRGVQRKYREMLRTAPSTSRSTHPKGAFRVSTFIQGPPKSRCRSCATTSFNPSVFLTMSRPTRVSGLACSPRNL